MRNVQPLFADFEFGGLALAHNGNLTNAYACAANWCGAAACSSRPRDTEVIVHLIAISLYSTVEERMIDALRQVEGAYSLVALPQEA